MLFTRYNLFKNHGDFVHLNMLKWAMKYVPELGPSTVQNDETVNLIEIGTGGIDINTHKDGTGEEKSKHVPYTDVQVNGTSQPTFNLTTYGNLEARGDNSNGVFFDNYTKVIHPDEVGKTDFYAAGGISFYDKDTINVDGTSHKYITKLKYYNRENSGALTDANQDTEFKPYTSVIRDDNSLASQMKIKHDDGNHLTGVSFPATNEEYDIPTYDVTHIEVGGIRDDDVTPVSKEYKQYLLELAAKVDTSGGTRKQQLTGILIGGVNDGFRIDLSALNIMAERIKGSIQS